MKDFDRYFLLTGLCLMAGFINSTKTIFQLDNLVYLSLAGVMAIIIVFFKRKSSKS